MTLQEWADAALAHSFGNYIDVDGYYQGQCWDLAAHYARFVVGCPNLPTGSGGAEGVYRLHQPPIDDFFTRVANNPNDANQLPPAGALIVYGPTAGNPYGHIEIVMGSNASGVDVVYQDGFNPTQGPIRKFRRWGALPTMGWLVPKTTAKPDLQPFQRIVDSDGVNRRPAPNTQQAPLEQFNAGEVLDFAGWLYGETVSNNNIWFKGKYSDTYFWSGSFKGDANVDGLTDLNPVAPPPVTADPNLRVVGDGGLNVRSESSTLSTVLKTLPTGTGVTVSAFTTKGAIVEGNSVWFKIPDGWVWSGGLTNQSTAGLQDLTPTDTNTPTPPVNEPVVTYPNPSTDAKTVMVLNKKKPIDPLDYAPTDLVDVGGGNKMRAEAGLAFSQMQKAMADKGLKITAASGYRSFATQKTLYENYVKQDGQENADRYSARPGHSEHQTGLTMDLNNIDESFANTAEYTWLKENAYLFGFIERYPSDKEELTGYMYEPWHWRYIGTTVAKDMHDKHVTTLEEYYNLPGGKYPDQEPTTPEPIPTDPVTPTPTDPSTPTPDTNLTPSFIRTLVPYLVGLVVSFFASKGLNIPADYQGEAIAGLTVAFGQAYYLAIRWLETRINPRLGILLGKAKAPVYEEPIKKGS